MFSIAKPCVARAPPQRVDLVVVDRAALGDPRLERVDLLLDEAAHAVLQLADVGGQLGDDHAGTSLQ